MSALWVVVSHELQLLRRSKKVVLGQSVAIVILWSLLASHVRRGELQPLTGYFLLLLFVAAVGAPASVGVHAFVGEKERRTLEPLLLVPVSMRELMGGKFLTTMVVSLVELVCVYIAGVAAVRVFGQPQQYEYVVNPLTRYVAAVLAPLFAILFSLIALVVSGRSANTQAALSMTAFVAAPIVLVVFGLMLGALAISKWALLLATGVLVLMDCATFFVAASLLTPERLLQRHG